MARLSLGGGGRDQLKKIFSAYRHEAAAACDKSDEKRAFTRYGK